MWNKILTGISIILTVGVISFAYLYNQQKSINENLRTDNSRYERESSFKDSLYNVVIDANIRLIEANKVAEAEKAEIKFKLEEIENAYNEAIAELSNAPIDSIAAYIIHSYLGDTYKIKKVNDSTFVAFQEITVRDIANRNEAFKAQNKRIEQLNRRIASQDTLSKIQAREIGILTNTIDTTLTRFDIVNKGYNDCESNVVDLTNEVDKQKGLKRIGFITSGGLLLVILILI